jgi:integrase
LLNNGYLLVFHTKLTVTLSGLLVLRLTGDNNLNKRVFHQFLDRYRSDSTKRVYAWAIEKFINGVQSLGVVDLGKGGIETQVAKYLEFVGTETHYDAVESFFVNVDASPKSLGTMLGALRAFFKFAARKLKAKDLPDGFWKDLKRRRKGLRSRRALTIDVAPTAENLKKVLMRCPIHGRALFLTLASSGMRIGDVVELHIEDLHFNQELPDGTTYHEIEVLDQKTETRRVSFISFEAVEAIEEWLKQRNAYIKRASNRSTLYRKALHDDGKLFPFTSFTARQIWNIALRKARLDARDRMTKRRKFHPHSLRKFFRTKLAGTGVPVDLVHAFMGHEGYLDEYRRYTKEELVRWYLKGMSAVTIFGDGGSTKAELSLHKKALTALTRIVLSRMSKEELAKALQYNGIDPEMLENIGLGGGKSIKTEYEPDRIREILGILKLLVSE